MVSLFGPNRKGVTTHSRVARPTRDHPQMSGSVKPAARWVAGSAIPSANKDPLRVQRVKPTKTLLASSNGGGIKRPRGTVGCLIQQMQCNATERDGRRRSNEGTNTHQKRGGSNRVRLFFSPLELTSSTQYDYDLDLLTLIFIRAKLVIKINL